MKNFSSNLQENQNDFKNFEDDQIDQVWHLSGGGDCMCIRCVRERDEGEE